MSKQLVPVSGLTIIALDSTIGPRAENITPGAWNCSLLLGFERVSWRSTSLDPRCNERQAPLVR
jgi:hypothetical protein